MTFPHIRNNIEEHKCIFPILDSLEFDIESVATKMIECVRNGGKIIAAGNGGSMADAQHFVAELVNQFFNKDRPAIASIALGVNPSVVSSWSNDIAYNEQFSRELESIGRRGDILFLITTSGNSLNLINAAKLARDKGIFVVGLLGRDGGLLKPLTDLSITVNVNSTPRIQEAHLLIYHTLAEIIEGAFIDDKYCDNGI